MSYQVIVAKIDSIKKHPTADRLMLASVLGNQVIVGLDSKEGDIGLFFAEGGQLSYEFCHNNNLHNNKTLNKDQTKSGFFSENRRVRAQKFRGEKSDGYFCELTSLDFCLPVGCKFTPNVGESFDVFQEMPICNKYFTPATLQAMAKNKKKGRRVVRQGIGRAPSKVARSARDIKRPSGDNAMDNAIVFADAKRIIP